MKSRLCSLFEKTSDNEQQELIAMTHPKITPALLLAAAIFAAGVAKSDETTPPAPQTQNGITFLNGGIGKQQAQAMRDEAKTGYNLQLVFATEKTGQYKANVNVTITDAKGTKLVDAESVGPGFYAKLPVGQYKISAEANGTLQHKSIDVTEHNLVRYVLYWAAEPGQLAADTH
jgi:hypothetical protein